MRKLAIAVFLVFGLAAIGAVPPAQGAGPGELTEQIKEGLLELKSLRGPQLDRSIFDGKPLLVVFWSSW